MIKKLTESKNNSIGRFSKVKPLLNCIQSKAVPDYQGLKVFWLDYQTLLEAVLYGQQIIALETDDRDIKSAPDLDSDTNSCCGANDDSLSSANSAGCWPTGGGRSGTQGSTDSSRSDQSKLIIGLRGQPPFDGNEFPPLLWDAERPATTAEINTIAKWIDDGCHEDDAQITAQANQLQHQARNLATLACGERKHQVSTLCTNIEQKAQKGLRVRKEINSLAEREVQRLRDAIACVQTYNEHWQDERSFDFQARMHANSCQHGWEQFLPWHRLYLHFFEQTLQDFDEHITLPCWVWSDYADENRQSFNSKQLDQGKWTAAIAAIFAELRRINPLWFPQRWPGAMSSPTSYPTAADINRLLETSSWAEFGGRPAGDHHFGYVEQVHNSMHKILGGANPELVNGVLAPWSLTVKDTLAASKLGYKYMRNSYHYPTSNQHGMMKFHSEKAGICTGRFDAMMPAIAISMGIDFQSNTRLDKLERIDGGWQLKVRRVLGQPHKNNVSVSEPQNTELTASFVIDASGRSTALARRIGAYLEVYDQLIGFYRFYELSQSADATAMKGDSSTLLESMDQGWWYSAGLDRNQQVAAFMSDADFARAGKFGKHEHFERALQRTELIQPGLTELVPITEPIVDATHTQCLDQLAGEGWLAVGDASFTIDPLSSLGVFKALRVALLASYAIKDYFDGKDRGLHKYQLLATREFNQYLRKRRENYREETRFFDKQFWQRRGAA